MQTIVLSGLYFRIPIYKLTNIRPPSPSYFPYSPYFSKFLNFPPISPNFPYFRITLKKLKIFAVHTTALFCSHRLSSKLYRFHQGCKFALADAKAQELEILHSNVKAIT